MIKYISIIIILFLLIFSILEINAENLTKNSINNNCLKEKSELNNKMWKEYINKIDELFIFLDEKFSTKTDNQKVMFYNLNKMFFLEENNKYLSWKEYNREKSIINKKNIIDENFLLLHSYILCKIELKTKNIKPSELEKDVSNYFDDLLNKREQYKKKLEDIKQKNNKHF